MKASRSKELRQNLTKGRKRLEEQGGEELEKGHTPLLHFDHRPLSVVWREDAYILANSNLKLVRGLQGWVDCMPDLREKWKKGTSGSAWELKLSLIIEPNPSPSLRSLPRSLCVCLRPP